MATITHPGARAPAVEPAVVHAPPRGYPYVLSWLATVDHKRIGLLYGTTAFIMFIIGGIEALLIRLQLVRPNNNVIGPDVYNQLFTMHGTTMIFLVIMPLSVAFFNYIVPLQIGARDVAFPRLNAFSYWVFLSGALLLNASFLFGSAPDTGWYGYANLTGRDYATGSRVDYWVLGLQILGVASLAGAFNFLVTIVNMRCPGMSMMRMPLFCWTTLVTSILLVLAFPIITVALIFLLLDRFFGTNFYVTTANGDPLLWQHLFWLFGHPEVYILILPAMGVISEVMPVSARKPLFGYPFVVYATAAIAFLGFSVWSHHMFTVGMGPIVTTFFAASTMLIAVPTAIKIFNWIGTLWGGSINFTVPFFFAVGFVSMFIVGGLSGVMHASPPIDTQHQDSYFVVAHFHYVLFGGTMFGLFAGIYYWFSKFSGKLLNDRLGKLHFWLMLIGFNLTFGPQHFLGVDGMPRRTFTYSREQGFGGWLGQDWLGWNLVSTIGAFMMALGFLIFIINVFISLRNKERAPSDPWDGATLEWAISSPPPPYNFATVPVVYGRDAFWMEKHTAAGLADHGSQLPVGAVGAAAAEREAHADGQNPAAQVHMPGQSFFPIICAAGLALMAVGLLSERLISFIGLAWLLIGIFAWTQEPV